MGNSDSDSENECFESAEESLDEDEEVKSAETKSKKSENEVAELHCDNVESTPQLEKDVSINSTSYRKRPERVKRTNSNTTTKAVPKLPSTDGIFKGDKIVPDAFFQDITSNLSKNINKSLSTLQQKSSNVKDLILSSLPVSSVNDEEGFSYDDDTTQSLPEENQIPNSEEELQSKESSDYVIGSIIKERTVEEEEKKEEEEESCREEELIAERKTNSPVLDIPGGSNKERKPPDLRSTNKENSSEGDFNLKYDKLENNFEEVTNLLADEKQNALDSCINKEDRDRHKEETESDSEKVKENLEVSNSAFLNSSDTEILHKEGAINSDIKKEELITPSHSIHEPVQSHLFNDIEIKQNIDHNKFLESEKSNKLSFDENNLINSEPYTQNIEDNTNFIRNEKNFLEEETEVDLKCNLKELKTALENIVQDKKSNDNNEISENESSKEVTSHEEKVEVDQSFNDGWDDFDFSDGEVENIMANNTDTRNTDLKDSVVDNKISISEKISSGINKISSKAETTDQSVKNRAVSKTEKRSEDTKKPKQNPEPEEISDDTWDWDDNWGETTEVKKEKATVTSRSKNEETKDESSDLSKWTGWDTFAQKPQEKQGNWGLGSWGVDMLLNKATAVTQGISNVLEAGLGAPDPETLARMEKLEKEKLKEETEESPEYSGEVSKKNSLTNVNLFPVSGITSLVAGVTSKIVEHSKIQEIGSKVITGGLDTLETFGKKTMEVLQEGDPGLKNKRALLMGNSKPVLSQVLKEAREKADREMKKAEEKELAKKCHFETLFDDFQGMVHLEALEMLSKQCELKLEQIRSGMNSEEQEDLDGILEEVEQLCALDEFELDLKSSVLDFRTALQMAVEPLKNEISVQKIIQVHGNVNKWLEMSSETEPSLIIINQKLVTTLAELAAATVQQFHKSGELLSVKECRKTVEEVDALSRLTNILCTEINRLCERFILVSQSRSSAEGGDSLISMKEKVTVVMNNSTSYIRQAFDLLIPVLQLGAAV